MAEEMHGRVNGKVSGAKKVITVVLPKFLKEEFEKKLEAEDRNMSQKIRQMVAEYVGK